MPLGTVSHSQPLARPLYEEVMSSVNTGFRPQDAIRSVSSSHPHLEGEVCPYCDQPIPNDRAQEIWERFKQKERAQAEVIKRQMNEQLARERQQIESNATAAGIKIAEAAAQEKLADAERQKNEALKSSGNPRGQYGRRRQPACSRNLRRDGKGQD